MRSYDDMVGAPYKKIRTQGMNKYPASLIFSGTSQLQLLSFGSGLISRLMHWLIIPTEMQRAL